jgi:hypothetical protein
MSQHHDSDSANLYKNNVYSVGCSSNLTLARTAECDATMFSGSTFTLDWYGINVTKPRNLASKQSANTQVK